MVNISSKYVDELIVAYAINHRNYGESKVTTNIIEYSIKNTNHYIKNTYVIH